MKLTKHLLIPMIVTGLITGPLFARADNKSESEQSKAKPYPLKTCIVSGEALDDHGDMKPYSFVTRGQEVKLCCKSCLKDFNKDQAGFLKKIETAAKKQKK